MLQFLKGTRSLQPDCGIYLAVTDSNCVKDGAVSEGHVHGTLICGACDTQVVNHDGKYYG